MTTDTPATAASRGLALCRACHTLQPCPPGRYIHCRRCKARVSQRTPHSLPKTWFFIITAALMLVPANLLPMMSLLKWGRAEPDTILSGVIKLAEEGYPGIALIVFTASIVVPIGKLLALTGLLLSVQLRWPMSARWRITLFRVLEFLGRWSMLDIFVVAIMVALVHLGQVVAIQPGMGALMFGASVVATLFASLSFDPRLIWDAAPVAMPYRADRVYTAGQRQY
jgi:paraquat-inducible protein A